MVMAKAQKSDGGPVDPNPASCWLHVSACGTTALNSINHAIVVPLGMSIGGGGVHAIACIIPSQSASITPGSTKRPVSVVLDRPSKRVLHPFPIGPFMFRGILRTRVSQRVQLITVLGQAGLLTFPAAAHTLLCSTLIAKTAMVSHQCCVCC